MEVKMVPQSARVLIVEDDPEISQLLRDNLNATGFSAATAKDGKAMFAALAENGFDILLLDIMLPGEDGLSLCRTLRTPGSPYEDLPIIFLTALGEMTDRVVGLEMGADAYLAKPFEMRELVALIRAVLRRTTRTDAGKRHSRESAAPERINNIWSFGPWKVDMAARHLVDGQGVTIALSATEFRLLALFLEYPQKLLARERILEHMAERSGGYDRSIDVQISRLRAKLGDNGRNASLIRTMRGDGYMLAVPVEK